MTTAYTSLLGLALPVTGELNGTWGDVVNNSITNLLDSAIAGTTTISSDADVTLTTTTGSANQAREAIILWTATGTTTRNITAPAQSKIYTVINNSGGTQSIVIRGVGPTTGVTVPKGKAIQVVWNGSDFVELSPNSITGNVTISGNLTVNGTTISLSNSASVVNSLVSSGNEATLVLDANTSGTNYSNKIDFRSSGTSKWVLGGGNVGTGGDFDFSLYNYATSQMVLNVPNAGINPVFYGRVGVGGVTPLAGNLVVQTNVDGHGIFVVNDATANYGELYFGGSSSSGYQGIRADGRSTGWIRLLTNDTQRLNIDYTGAGTFYGTYWEYSSSYPYINNISGGSVRPLIAFNTTGTYYSGLYDSGLASTSGSRQYFARASAAGGAPSTVLLALDYQNNRVGIGTINPGADLQVSNPNGSGSSLLIKSISSGSTTLSLDSYTNSGGAATQIGFLLNGTTKWAFGYANIGATPATDMGIYNYVTTGTPWILTVNDYQRLPKTAAFMATVGSNYTSTGADVVRFSQVSGGGCFDNRSNFNTGSYRFVAPEDGFYQFNAVVNMYAVSAGTVLEIYFRKNATQTYAGGRMVSGTSGDQQITAGAVIYMTATDYVDVYSQNTAGFSSSTRWNTFSGHLIG